MKRGIKRVTITFQPEPDVSSLLSKALNFHAGRGARTHGLRTRFINEAVRSHFARLRGKREQSLAS